MIKMIATFASIAMEPGIDYHFAVHVYERDDEPEPFVCRLYDNGQPVARSDYFTTDRRDAIRVAADMLTRAVAQVRTTAMVASRAARFPKRPRARQHAARAR